MKVSATMACLHTKILQPLLMFSMWALEGVCKLWCAWRCSKVFLVCAFHPCLCSACGHMKVSADCDVHGGLLNCSMILFGCLCEFGETNVFNDYV